MQTVFQPGQFKLAAIQPAPQNNNAQNVLSSLTPNQMIKADVLSATLQQRPAQQTTAQQTAAQQTTKQQATQQTIAQYKAQIVIQGKIIDIITQFPLDKGDQLELKVTQNQQLSIEKVTPQTQRPDLNNSVKQPASQDAQLLQNAAKTVGTSQSQSAESLKPEPIKPDSFKPTTPVNVSQEQINNVIKMWLGQSRPSTGALLDLSITMEAVASIIKQLPNAPQASMTGGDVPKALPLSNLLLLVSQSIQKDLFDRLPHSGQTDFKANIQTFIRELVTWQSPLTNSNRQNVSPQMAPLTATPVSPQQTLIAGLIQLQGLIDQALAPKGTAPQPSQLAAAVHQNANTSTPLPNIQTSTGISPSAQETQASHIPILKEWTQVLSLMTPTTQSQSDLLDWMLESIRRIAGNTTTTDIAAAAKEAKAQSKEALTPAQTATTSSMLPANSSVETQRAIDSSQWLRLAEFRKHQLFTGNVKQSLLQGTTELQISNVLRQLMVNVEELTGRMTALRLASAGSQIDANTPTHIHIDLPIMTHTGPTSVGIDISEELPKESDTTGSNKPLKSQWLVHLKFELPPLAPFIGQIIYDVDNEHLTANFYSDHKETLSVLNEHLADLEQQCRSHLSSQVSVNTRFGMINMPRESIVKTSSQSLSVKV